MPDKTKVILPTGEVEGVKINVKETTERWTEVTLDDGTILRIKPLVINVVRLDGRYDAEGNPSYAVQGNFTMVMASVPDHLKKNPNPQVH